MKKFGFLVALAMSAMTMFTSCLGEGGNKMDVVVSGIVFNNEKAGYQPMVDVGSAIINVPQMATKPEFSENTCWILPVNIDYNKPENADFQKKGYLTGTLNFDAIPVKSYYPSTIYSESDTTVMMPDETPLSYGFSMSEYNNFVRGWFIFPSGMKIGSKQTLEMFMYYPSEVKPTLVDGENCYDLYLRATLVGDATGAGMSNMVNAYFLKGFFDRVNAIENEANHDRYTLRVHYVSEIEKETNKLIWKFDKALMPVIKKQQDNLAPAI